MSSTAKKIMDLLDQVDTGRKSDRNLDIFKRYTGFGFFQGLTMEVAGEPYELTRESVRQILNRFRAAFAKMYESSKGDQSSFFRVIEETYEIAAKRAPISVESLVDETGLEDEKSVQELLSLYLIATADRCEHRLFTFNNTQFFIAKNHDTMPKLIMSKAIQEISHNGAVKCGLIREALKLPEEADLFVQQVIESTPAAVKVEIDDVWYHFGHHGRNRLINRIYKIFTFYSEVSVGSLMKAINRSWAKDKKEISRSIPADAVIKIAEFLGASIEHHGSDVDKAEIAFSTPSDAQAEVNSVEYEMLNMIRSCEDGEVNEKTLEEQVVGDDPSLKYSFSIALNHSPLLMRQRRGVYTLLR